jgi:hypothetical protein
MNQEKIAIDIVLLLPQHVEQLVCDLSRKIIAPQNTRALVLDGKDYIPHISLLMGTIESADIEKYYESLETIVKKYLPMNIVISSLENNNFPSLKIEKSNELSNLQKEIMQTITLDHDATPEMFVNAEGGKEQVDWVNNFITNSSGDNFDPHVTLGIGDASAVKTDFPLKTATTRAAVCRLGYACSCRKIIKEF